MADQKMQVVGAPVAAPRNPDEASQATLAAELRSLQDAGKDVKSAFPSALCFLTCLVCGPHDIPRRFTQTLWIGVGYAVCTFMSLFVFAFQFVTVLQLRNAVTKLTIFDKESAASADAGAPPQAAAPTSTTLETLTSEMQADTLAAVTNVIKQQKKSVIIVWISCVSWALFWIGYFALYYGLCPFCIVQTLGVNAIIAGLQLLPYMQWKKASTALQGVERAWLELPGGNKVVQEGRTGDAVKKPLEAVKESV